MNATQVRFIVYPILFIAIILFGTYTFVVYSNRAVYVPPAPIKPIIPFSLDYPDSIEITRLTGLSVSFSLVANSTIAENTTIFIVHPFGEILSPNYHNVTTVSVLFEETVPANWNITTANTLFNVMKPGILFTNTNKSPTTSNSTAPYFLSDNTEILSPQYSLPFRWLVSGDYSPTIEIEFSNTLLTEYSYNQIKIHVASLIDIQNQKMAIESQKLAIQNENLNSVNTLLTFVLVAVAVVEVVRIIEDTLRDRDRSHS